MNALVAHYHATNEADGHDRNCAWGAGGDCYCTLPIRQSAERYRRLQERRDALDAACPRLDAKAKFQALKQLWAPIARDAIHAGDPAFNGPHDDRAARGHFICDKLEELLKVLENYLEDLRTDAEPA